MELKKAFTYQEQLDLLKRRGCIIKDDKQALQILENTNYYRLSAYFLPFKKTDNTYKEDTSLEQVFAIYEFDRKFRHILFTAIEEIEVNFRARLAYFHAHKYGADGYLSSKNFNIKHDHQKFLDNFNREVISNRKVPFVVHHIEKYNGTFPIWVATELFTFGMLS